MGTVISMPRTRRAKRIELGARIKAVRQRAGLSLRALGAATGFSASFLSQVELGQASPSLASLERIAQALSVTLGELLGEPPAGAGPVIRRRDQETLRSEWSRATLQPLLAAEAQPLEAVLIKLEPGGRSGKTPRRTGKVFAFCARGRVTFVLEEDRHLLAEGDSVFFDAARSSRWENPHAAQARILLVTLRRSL